MDEEKMVCINNQCNYNDELYFGRCTKGENEPKIYECEESLICQEGHVIIDKISHTKEAQNSIDNKAMFQLLCQEVEDYVATYGNNIAGQYPGLHGLLEKIAQQKHT